MKEVLFLLHLWLNFFMSQEKKRKKKAYKVGEILLWLFYFVSPLHLITHSVSSWVLHIPPPPFIEIRKKNYYR